ncbi:terpene cyclase/mutase family protein [Stieleria sp. TO1_6]|uniref:prenyltransferase/squalene oxidase repeat-containing protein n=1 Tax=Stieleria tagensis TaxID=2956795 RepID=UPI00209B9D9B|nr:prenyltransferase/squalene oxidase repeat-containing protein [Stieleria tagensis]MCO8123164.1 terpene cyclase/mutase family protein [Stieleria tagensis]
MNPKSAPTDSNRRWRGRGDPVTSSEGAPGQLQPPPVGAPPIVPQQPVSPASDRTAETTCPAVVVDPDDTPVGTGGLLTGLGSVRTSSWLTSAAIHLCLLIVLAVLTYRLGGNERGISIDGSVSSPGADVEFETIQTEAQQASSDAPSFDQPVNVPLVETSTSDAATSIAVTSITAPDQAYQVNDLATADLKSGSSPANTAMQTFLGGGGMSARTPEGRKKYGDLYGATAASETAVENALRWLAAHQRSNGSWSFDLSLDPCDGQCGNSRKVDDDTPTPATAATGLALLAFMGAGYTSDVGPYQETVTRGFYYLKSAATESESGYDWQQSGSMYGHGIAMMALSEALGMTQLNDRYDSDLLHFVERGALFTTIAQHPNGSWGYTPASPGDTTVTGWQLLSLVGARKAGIPLPSTTFPKTKAFLMSVREEPTYQFGYNTPEPRRTTTAIALTLMMYLGQTPGNTLFDEAVDQLASAGPKRTDVYHDYYATMALHHWRHPGWEKWNTALRDHLVQTQATQGHEAGSWHFKDPWGDIGGRVYTTAMCTLILEVYYRFLPLYEKPSDFPL